jgi:hypothetical protein
MDCRARFPVAKVFYRKHYTSVVNYQRTYAIDVDVVSALIAEVVILVIVSLFRIGIVVSLIVVTGELLLAVVCDE